MWPQVCQCLRAETEASVPAQAIRLLGVGEGGSNTLLWLVDLYDDTWMYCAEQPYCVQAILAVMQVGAHRPLRAERLCADIWSNLFECPLFALLPQMVELLEE